MGNGGARLATGVHLAARLLEVFGVVRKRQLNHLVELSHREVFLIFGFQGLNPLDQHEGE